MPRLLTPEETSRQLRDLPGWAGGPDGLARSYEAPDFAAAVRVVVDVAEVAEELDHHPDIDVRWRTVRFALVTHSAGGVTQLDVELAHRIDEAARAHGAA